MSANLNQHNTFRRDDTEHAHNVARRLRTRLLSLSEASCLRCEDTIAFIARETITKHDARAFTLHRVNDDRRLELALAEIGEGVDAKQLQFLAKRVAADAVSSGVAISGENLHVRFRDEISFHDTPVTSFMSAPVFDLGRKVTGVITVFGGGKRVFYEDDEYWLNVAARLIADCAAQDAARAKIAELTEQLERLKNQKANEAETESSVAAPDRGSVLVIDDDETLNEVICEFLQDEGFQVESAGDGLEAMRIFRPAEHRIVMTDVAMPHMNGWELIAALRVRAPELPVVLITGYSSNQWNEAFLRKQGVIAVLSKPLDFDKMSNVLRGITLEPIVAV